MGEANKRGTQPDPKESGDPATNRKGCMMDAREKWHKESMRLVGEFAKTVGNACFGLFVDESKPALDRLEAHLRTTPEGFALVPVEPTEAMITSIVGETIGYGGGEFAPEIKRYEAIHLIKEIIKAAAPPKSEPL